MVEFVHLPIHVLVEQDGLVLTAKQVCVHCYYYTYISLSMVVLNSRD